RRVLFRSETLNVGRNDASASGAVTVSAPIDETTPSTAGGFTVPTLHLLSGAGVTKTGTGNLTATSLVIDAASIGSSGTPLTFQATNLTTNTVAANGNQFLSATGSGSVTSPDGLAARSRVG